MLLQIQCFSTKSIPEQRGIADQLKELIILGIEKRAVGALVEPSGNHRLYGR